MKRNLFLGIAAAALLGFQVNAQTCTQVDVTTQAWTYPEGTQGMPNPVIETFTINDPSDSGFQFDVAYLDNSFSLNINGTDISTQELQFQGTAGLTQNVKFSDGTPSWGVAPTLQIWELGDPQNQNPPTILRVTISAAGVVSLSGISNNTDGVFHPIQLTSGSFNTVTWNSTGTNTFKVTQSVEGDTGMRFIAYGLSNCPSLGTNEVNFKGFAYNSIVKGQLQLKSSNAIQDVKIYNMTGQLVRTAQPNTGNANINLQELQPGVYVMNVTINGTTKAYKVVKQ